VRKWPFVRHHLSGFQLAATFVWGLGLGLIFLRTEPLLAPTIAHPTVNMVSFGRFLSGLILKQ